MGKIIIGVDPDSKAHGVAVYKDGNLKGLYSLSMVALCNCIRTEKERNSSIELHIEDVNAVSAAFNARDKRTNIHVKLKMAQHIGMCKQAQIEVERWCEHYDVKVVKHPISKMWKNQTGKKQFESVTGWTGRSNEDSRSGAYFGFLGCK